MKTLFVTFLLTTMNSLGTPININDISKALQSGNTEQLALYFDDQVQVSILDNEALHEKQAAKQELATFFSNNSPVAFEQLHKGVSEGQGSTFFIGNLKTTTNSFRVYIYLHTKADKFFIQELRIDEE